MSKFVMMRGRESGRSRAGGKGIRNGDGIGQCVLVSEWYDIIISFALLFFSRPSVLYHIDTDFSMLRVPIFCLCWHLFGERLSMRMELSDRTIYWDYTQGALTIHPLVINILFNKVGTVYRGSGIIRPITKKLNCCPTSLIKLSNV